MSNGGYILDEDDENLYIKFVHPESIRLVGSPAGESIMDVLNRYDALSLVSSYTNSATMITRPGDHAVKKKKRDPRVRKLNLEK